MILITGATGNIGRTLVTQLLARTAGLPEGAEVVEAEGFIAGYLLPQAEAANRPAPVSHTVEEILGRPGTDFATWAADHAESFRGMAA